mgnify:CR=1 FL=1
MTEQNGFYPPQPNGNYYGMPDPMRVARKKREKHELRLQSTFASCAVLTLVLVQNISVLILNMFGLYERYRTEPFFQAGADIIILLFSLLLPFMIFGKLIEKQSGLRDSLPFEKPKAKGLMPLAIVSGLGFCMIANIVTNVMTSFVEAFGVELSSPDIPMPQGVFGVIVSFFRVVVFAAFVEEIAFRGYIMQNLRKFGDGFAIAMAALVFGLMHCNLIQAPFALIVGFALGYLSIKTGTLWTAVIIHGLNNSISLIVTYLNGNVDETLLNNAASLMIYALILAAVPCFFIFVRKANALPSFKTRTELSTGSKVACYLTTPTMLIAIVLMLYFTAQYVKLV